MAQPGAAHQPVLGLTPEQLGMLPDLPGVYIMRDTRDAAIYIGKASNLRSRVRSYFTKAGDARFNVRFLMRHVVRVETILTANEKEAFLLENTLIKKHQPRYNIRLRDDKTYVSVKIDTTAPWPRAQVVRRRGEARPRPGQVFLGPYASAASVRQTLRWLQRIFPLRSCPDHVLANRARPCLLHQIGRCCAPCVKPVDQEEYQRMVEGTVLFLKGRTREVVRLLERQMAAHANALNYEQAAAVRDRIRAIEETTEHQGVHRHAGSDWDVVALERSGPYGAFVVFICRNGLLTGSRPFLVRHHDRAPEELMEEFLSRYYDEEAPPAELLVCPMPTGQALLEEWLCERRGSRVNLSEPQRGERRRQLETAQANARQLLEQQLSGETAADELQQELMDKFHLPAPPDPIECFDISTIQGHATVASMVTFENGEPDKSRYRRFRIRSLAGQDDFGAMREVLTRRLRRVVEGADEPPGLIVIDGGKGQLAVALDVMRELGINGVPAVGMAKSRVKHRGDQTWRSEERFFLPGRKNPVTLREGSPAWRMLVHLRDEAHRFGIEYHRLVRSRRDLRSRLEEVPGIGRGRAGALLRHFGSLHALREATPDQLAELPGITRELAERILSHPWATDEASPSAG